MNETHEEGTVLTDPEQIKANAEAEEKRKIFNEKAKAFTIEMEELVNKFGVGIVAGIYFREEDLSGVHAYGPLTHIEEIGLAKKVEQKFLA